MKNAREWWDAHGAALYRLAAAAALLLGAFSAAAAGDGPLRGCTMAYVLQAERLSSIRLAALDRLARSARDTVVLDRSFGAGGGDWTIPEIESLRGARAGRRVLSYLSIGEAEDYRRYWQPAWRLAADGSRSEATPAFVVAPNPDWPGNYKVAYWREPWQRLVLDQLDELVANTFDGVYLDIVDAFEFFEHDAASDTWEAGRVNPATGRSYREDMVEWVLALAERAREREPGFLIVPQNGSALLHFPAYLAAIDAIGVEDLFTLDDEPQAPAHTEQVLADLELARAAGKPVLVIEYARDAGLRQRAIDAAAARGFSLLLTGRALGRLGVAQPPPRCATQAVEPR